MRCYIELCVVSFFRGRMDQSATLAVIGACVLSLGIVLAAIGFVSPWWVSYEYGRDDSNGPYVYYDRSATVYLHVFVKIGFQAFRVQKFWSDVLKRICA